MLATTTIDTHLIAWHLTNRNWLSQLHAALTILIYILITFNKLSILELITNSPTIVNVLKHIQFHRYELPRIYKLNFSSHLIILNTLLSKTQISFGIDKE